MYVYLGPYINLKKLEKEIKVGFSCCLNEKCSDYQKKDMQQDKFCSNCGQRIKKHQTSEKEIIDFYQWCPEKYKNELVTNHSTWETEILMEDLFSDFYILRNFDDEYDEDLTELTEELKSTFHDGINKFQEKHKDLIEYLKQYFGEKNVNLHWGIVIYE